MDRRLQPLKRRLGRRLYGRTKPGSLLKHHIPLQTSSWTEARPGFTEIDLVSHSGNAASGEFLHSLNVTDLATTWVETRAVLGKGQSGIVQALTEISQALPFSLRGVDSDNGSEFINHHLVRFCQQREIQFTRSRPYKKDDNAHIEQKNWTHVRKLLGWDRYDSPSALEALNDLYRNELRLMMNLYQPTVKLESKVRVGSRLRRRYSPAQTPLDRLLAHTEVGLHKAQELQKLRETLDPFELSKTIERKRQRIYRLANLTLSPKTADAKAA
jgi:transposase InsO family protein